MTGSVNDASAANAARVAGDKVWKDDSIMFKGQKFALFSFAHVKDGLVMLNFRGSAESEEVADKMAKRLQTQDSIHSICRIPVGVWFPLKDENAKAIYEDATQQEILDFHAEHLMTKQEKMEKDKKRQKEYAADITKDPMSNSLFLTDQVMSYTNTLLDARGRLEKYGKALGILKKKEFKDVLEEIASFDLNSLSKLSLEQ